ncbi:MAG TPA: hypothetical protein ENJ95_11425, partial [Bacteroidetes bacterium]|nr:hypothetical protein [Bacteroidota bacterium]
MIARTAFLFLLFSFSFSLNAQKRAPASLEWGPEYNEPSNTFATKLIGLRPNGFYVLREKILSNPEARQRAWVEFYDREMNMKKRVEQELKYKGKKRDFEDVIFLGGQLYLLTSFNNSAKKKNYLFKQKISMKSLIPSKKLEMICETEARNKEVEGTFDFHISKDSSHLLLYNQLPYKKNEPERFGFRVFDQNFDLAWEKDIVLPFPDNQFTVEDYQVDDKGNVHLLGVLYKDGSKWRRRGNPTYQYIILSYSQNGEKEEEFRIDLADRFITDLTFRVAKNGELICSGFYSERGTYGIKGAFYMRLDPVTREVKNRNSQPFEFDFLTEFMSERNKKKARDAERKNNAKRRAELYDYSLDELILRSDGGAVLVAEQYYVQQEYYDTNPYGFYPYGYGYGY